jgi:hypothetical protein
MTAKEKNLVLVENFYKSWHHLKLQLTKDEIEIVALEMATHVKKLSRALQKSPILKNSLLNYFLDTVWGAPFVYSLSLSQACKNQREFKALITHMLEHYKTIDQEILVAKDEIQNIFRLKKSA